MNSPCSTGLRDSGTQSAAGRTVQGHNSSRRASEKWEVTVHFAGDSLSASLAASPVDCLAEVKCSDETPLLGILLSLTGWSQDPRCAASLTAPGAPLLCFSQVWNCSGMTESSGSHLFTSGTSPCPPAFPSGAWGFLLPLGP